MPYWLKILEAWLIGAAILSLSMVLIELEVNIFCSVGCAIALSIAALLIKRSAFPIQAFRILPRGTCQIRVLGKWRAIEIQHCARTQNWLTLIANIHPFTHIPEFKYKKFTLTLWRQAMSYERWRRLCLFTNWQRRRVLKFKEDTP